MAKSRCGKQMIALEVDESLFNAIKELSLDYGIGISGVIRMVMIDYLKRYANYNPKDEKGDKTKSC